MNKFYKVSRNEFIRSIEDSKFNIRDKNVLLDNIGNLYNGINLPARSTKNSAGYDFYSPIPFTLHPKESILIPTGIKVELDCDKVLIIFPRSSVGVKHGIRLTNTAGIIDSDYFNNKENEGHILISLENTSDRDFICYKDDRIVQGIIVKYYKVRDEVTTNNMRGGGFGSTG